MPICSYLVVPAYGAADGVCEKLAGLPECEVIRAVDRDMMIMVTETGGLEEEHDLRARVEAMEGVQALLLTFGEIDPDTELADPVMLGARGPRHLDLVDQGDGSASTPLGARVSVDR